MQKIQTPLKPQKRMERAKGSRTLDTHVGNVMLYQAELRSLPEVKKEVRRIPDFKLEFRPVCPRCPTLPDHLEQVVMIDGLVEKRHRATRSGTFLVFKFFQTGDDDDGDFLCRIQPMKPIHDAKTVPRNAVHLRRKTNVQQNQIGFSLRAAATASDPSNAVIT